MAIRAFVKQRMLSLTLERMGITTPSVYAFAARQAQRFSSGNPSRQFRVIAQVQSTLAVVVRMSADGTLTHAQTERLVQSLFTVPLEGDRYQGALLTWVRRELMPLLPAASDAVDARVIGEIEGRLIEGLAGRNTTTALVEWEGQSYRLDLAAGERQRLRLVRRKAGRVFGRCRVHDRRPGPETPRRSRNDR